MGFAANFFFLIRMYKSGRGARKRILVDRVHTYAMSQAKHLAYGTDDYACSILNRMCNMGSGRRLDPLSANGNPVSRPLYHDVQCTASALMLTVVHTLLELYCHCGFRRLITLRTRHKLCAHYTQGGSLCSWVFAERCEVFGSLTPTSSSNL